MHPDLKRDWIAALRSGYYKQGVKALRTYIPGATEENCCLGVLCKVAGEAFGIEEVTNGCHEDGFRYQGRTSVGLLGTTLAQTLGLRLTDEAALAYMNDQGRDFDEIADWIEENI